MVYSDDIIIIETIIYDNIMHINNLCRSFISTRCYYGYVKYLVCSALLKLMRIKSFSIEVIWFWRDNFQHVHTVNMDYLLSVSFLSLCGFLRSTPIP